MKCTAFNVDSEKRMPLFATIPSGILYSDAKPVTIVGPNSFLNSKNRLPSTIRAMSSRTSKLFFVSFGMIPGGRSAHSWAPILVAIPFMGRC